MVHNYYQQRGGEDESTDQEVRLLEKYHHKVLLYSRQNSEIKGFSPARKGLLFFEPLWSFRTFRDITSLFKKFAPDIVHVQNFVPLISGSLYYASSNLRVPIVQSLRNYRLLCPVALLFRAGSICKECIDKSLWRGIFHGCYRNSKVQTASLALMLFGHRLAGTWSNKVDAFIALTEFSRKTFASAGIPATKILVRSNFLERDPGLSKSERDYALFVGRLTTEKGLHVILDAWRKLPGIPLRIVGDGPMLPWLKEFVQQNGLTRVEVMGRLSSPEVFEYLKKACFLVMPSNSYETFGRTIIEAYATGTPVIVSRLGAMEELVKEGKTGLLFAPGSDNDLAQKASWAWEHRPEMTEMGRIGRAEYETKFTAERNYEILMEIYRRAIEYFRSRSN
jgi:glycosyltransferase involved in cell wall biosynthesis